MLAAYLQYLCMLIKETSKDFSVNSFLLAIITLHSVTVIAEI